MPLLILLLFLILSVTFAQSGSSTDIGTTTFYNFDTVSGSKQSIGTTDFYNFSDGSSTTRNSVGNSDFYSGSIPSLSGSTNTVGGTTFGNWQDGTTSTHQSIGGRRFTTSATARTARAIGWGRIRLQTAINGGVECCT